MRSPTLRVDRREIASPGFTGEVLTLLAELIAEVRGLRSDLRRERPNRLTRSDRDRLARILPAVGGVVGSELFAIRELFASAAPAVRVVLEHENAKALGRLFQRAAGSSIGEYTIRAEGRELNAVLWRITKVDEFPR